MGRPGGHGTYRWPQGQWEQIDGGAIRVAVTPSGQPWVVNSIGEIFSRTSIGWQRR